MNDLIERLEKATGPDLDLDHAIAAAVRPEDGHGVLLYTASIDAAITLMPEDTEWSCVFARQGGFGGVARVWHMDQHEADMGQATTAATPAIALCIAALNLHAALNIQDRTT